MSAKINIDNNTVIIDEYLYESLSKKKWHITHYGYAACFKKGGGFEYMHRTIMDAKRGQEVDHINRNKIDNRKENLRFVTRSENRQNEYRTEKLGIRFSSKYKGVYWNKAGNKWRSRITVNRKVYNGGSHVKEIDAAKAYNKLALIHYGKNASINKLNED